MLTSDQAAVVKGLLARGEKQHDVAAFFGVNGGRIAEIAKGKKFPEVEPARKKDLPLAADIAGGFAIYAAEQALLRAKLGVEAAIAFLQDLKSSHDRQV